MNTKNRDLLWVVWKDTDSRQKFVIGKLYKSIEDKKFHFKYILEGVKEALKFNFKPILCFSQINAEYENDYLFPVFSTRLPDKRRRDIDKILNKYGLNKYDSFELLKKSGGKLPTDNLEFVEPIILNDSEEEIIRTFFIAGTRYYDLCKNKVCINSVELHSDEKLKLVCEENNEYDKFAVAIYSVHDNKLGYTPKYYSESVFEAIKRGYKVTCTVIDFYKSGNCNECLKAKLVICIKV